MVSLECVFDGGDEGEGYVGVHLLDNEWDMGMVLHRYNPLGKVPE